MGLGEGVAEQIQALPFAKVIEREGIFMRVTHSSENFAS